jgi:hypothetical protein
MSDDVQRITLQLRAPRGNDPGVASVIAVYTIVGIARGRAQQMRPVLFKMFRKEPKNVLRNQIWFRGTLRDVHRCCGHHQRR